MCELPYNPSEWQSVGCVQTQPATEANVGRGGAVFAQRPPAERIYPMSLPYPVIWSDDNGQRRAGLVVQAERQSSNESYVILGVVEPNGQNNVVFLDDASLLERPNAEWFEIANRMPASKDVE
jgi:hypothetical protein